MKKILEWGAVCFLALFLSVMPVQASEPTVTEDTGVSAEGKTAKGELIFGTFGVNNGLSWIYDSGTKIPDDQRQGCTEYHAHNRADIGKRIHLGEYRFAVGC